MDNFSRSPLPSAIAELQGIVGAYSLDWTVAVDLGGLAIAIIGFFDLARPIEARFREIKDNAETANEVFKRTLGRILPLHKNGWRIFADGFRTMLFLVLPSFLIALPISGQLEPFIRWLKTIDWRILLAGALAAPAALFIYTTLIYLLVNRMMKLFAWLIWKILSILAAPPAGILGTIGLAVAVIGFLT